MKKFNKYIALFSLAILIGSCCEVEFPNLETPAPPNGSRRALIMDFTGHLCAGCPGAARIANEISATFPDHATVLAVHPDFLGLTTPLSGNEDDPFTTDWRTPEGNHYQSIFNISSSIPVGVVSGLQENGAYETQALSWQGQVSDLIFQERPATVDLQADYAEDTRTLDISSSVLFQQDLEGSYGLILATVETNIIDWQKNGTSTTPADPAYDPGDIDNYVHKHVLRNHVNGLTGDIVVSAGALEGEAHDFSHTAVLSEDFVQEEVSILAYVYNTETLEVIDVVEHHIIE